MNLALKYNIEELKKTATRTSLLYSDDRVMFSFLKDLYFKLETIENIIELENELHLTEVAEAIKEIYNKDTELTHIEINLQVRPIESEKKKSIINGKLYL